MNEIDIKLNKFSSLFAPEKAFSGENNFLNTLNVYYISDIHLESYFKNFNCQFQNDNKEISKDLKKEINRLVNNIFPKEIEKDFFYSRQPIVLVCGDTSSSIKINKYFYDRLQLRYTYFLYKRWKENHIQKQPVSTEDAEKEYNKTLISLQKEHDKEILKIEKFGFKYHVLNEMDDDEFEELLENNSSAKWLLKAYEKIWRINNKIKEFVSNKNGYLQQLTDGVFFTPKKHLPIYAILGNHELQEFKTFEECVEAYSCKLNGRINFLEGNGFEYDNYMILGGIGLAGKNEVYNCNTLVTTNPPMKREEEIKISKEFSGFYADIKKIANERRKRLIVATHYPPKDWLYDKCDLIATYFAGHTHRNESLLVDGAKIITNNQVGYNSSDIKFIKITLGTKFNPFVKHKDGYYEITVNDYEDFMSYCEERIQGTAIISDQICRYNAKLYMIKHKGFYGFFLLNPVTGAKICEGGRIKNIGQNTNVEYYYGKFPSVLEKYVTAMAPYRLLQSEISSELKELGFDGNIHGCIIDIDYFNHVLLDPFDGKIYFYNSPTFGDIKTYNSFENLLIDLHNSSDQQPKLNERISKLKNLKTLNLTHGKNIPFVVEEIRVGRRNPVYVLSERINQLQRLFNSNVLRLWDENTSLKIDKDN